MSRSDKMYGKSPKLERDEDDKIAVKKGSETAAEKKADKKEGGESKKEGEASTAVDGMEEHHEHFKEMHERHRNEMKDMHKRHQKEHEMLTEKHHGGEGKKIENDKGKKE